MKELVLTAMGYDVGIKFTDNMIDQFEEIIIYEAKKRNDVLIYSNTSSTITICFSEHKGMMDFAGYVCKLCLPFL